MKFSLALVALYVAGTSAFAPMPAARSGVQVCSEPPKKGAGGMNDTRDPEAYQDEDPRKSIADAPSFEEYLKKRQAEGN